MTKILLVPAIAGLFTAPAAAAPLYSNDFDGNVTVGAGVTVTPFTNSVLESASTGAWNADGWAGKYLASRATGDPAPAAVLTLTNLKPHTQVSVKFLLGFLESWDSSNGSCCAPDALRISIDGIPVLSGLTADNVLGNVEDYGGGTELYDGPNINSFAHVNTVDTLVDMASVGALTFAHTGSSLTFSIQAYGPGWQGGGDEAWGIDSLVMTYDGVNAVPEPATWAMMIAGFGLAGAAMRRRGAVAAHA